MTEHEKMGKFFNKLIAEHDKLYNELSKDSDPSKFRMGWFSCLENIIEELAKVLDIH